MTQRLNSSRQTQQTNKSNKGIKPNSKQKRVRVKEMKRMCTVSK